MAILKEKNALASKYNLDQIACEKSFNDLMVLRDENATIINLPATDSTKRYIARVYWNHYTRETFIDPLSLPTADSTKAYQLWAMDGEQPVDAGVFFADMEKGVQRAKSISNADSWIITLEPRGGSTVPAGDHICMSNN